MGRKDERMRTEMADDIRKTAKKGMKGRKLNNKNWIRNLLILIIAVLAIAGIVLFISTRRMNIKQEEIKNYNYFIFSENDKTGVIDKTGKVVINPEYNYIQIPNPEKPLFVCLYDYDASTQSYNSKVLNEKGEQLLSNYKNIAAISANNDSSEWSYQTSILTYKENNKIGIITTTGKKVSNAIYDSVESLDYKDEVLKVNQDGKYGLIKLNGEKTIKEAYNSITADGYYNDDSKYEAAGYVVSVKEDDGYKYGYIDNKGKVILENKFDTIKRLTTIKNDGTAYLITSVDGKAGLYKNSQSVIKNKYENIEYDDTNKILSIQENGKYGVYDLYGNMILPIQYEDINFAGILITAHKDGKQLIFDANGNIQKNFAYTNITPTKTGDYRITVANNKFGIMDNNSMVQVENKYDYIEQAFDKYFIFTNNQKSGIIDNTGKIILNNKYNVIQNVSKTNVIQAIDDSDKSEIYNKNMKKVLEVSNAHIYVKDNYIKIISDQGINYLDFDGNEKNPTEIFTNNTIFAKKQNGKWGYVDKNGNTVVEFKYEMATNINEFGFGAIKQNGKWGVIDSQGNVVKDAKYQLVEEEPTFIGEFYKESADYEITSYSRTEVEANK